MEGLTESEKRIYEIGYKAGRKEQRIKIGLYFIHNLESGSKVTSQDNGKTWVRIVDCDKWNHTVDTLRKGEELKET